MDSNDFQISSTSIHEKGMWDNTTKNELESNSQRLGELLLNEREKRNLSVENVASQIKISIKYINAIENNNAQNLLSKVYLIGYTRMYANFFNIPSSIVEHKLVLEGLNDSTTAKTTEESTYNKESSIDFKFNKVTRNFIIFSIIILTIFFEIYYLYHNNRITNLDLKKHILQSAIELNKLTSHISVNSYNGLINKSNYKTSHLSQPVLVANNDTWVKIYDSTSRLISSQNLKTGDILFIPSEEGIIIDAENKNAIEYFDHINFQTLEQRLTHKLSDPFYIKSARFIPYNID